MRGRAIALLTAGGLVLGLASSLAEDPKPPRRESAAVAKHRPPARAVQPGSQQFQGGVPKGPLYFGQDYLGNDPDPNIRSQILRDLGGRYGGPE
jgi:hypothetical protein